MNAEIRHKRELLQQRQASVRNSMRLLRHSAKEAAASPSVLITAFAAGYFIRVINNRRSEPVRNDGKQVSVSPLAHRFTVLGGALLGTALRSGLRGLAREMFQSTAEKATSRPEPA